jgi:ATP-dependent RNA helicase DDX56/DBP9
VRRRQLLRHDKPLHKVQPAAHLKHIPSYLKDAAAAGGRSSVGGPPGALLAGRRRRLHMPAHCQLRPSL